MYVGIQVYRRTCKDSTYIYNVYNWCFINYSVHICHPYSSVGIHLQTSSNPLNLTFTVCL